MTSMVFNIYHKSFFTKMLNWDEENRNVNNNAIDRYIESQGDLRVVTTLPFLVGHKEEQTSSIWHFNNSQYNELFEKTVKLFNKKIIDFKSKTSE